MHAILYKDRLVVLLELILTSVLRLYTPSLRLVVLLELILTSVLRLYTPSLRLVVLLELILTSVMRLYTHPYVYMQVTIVSAEA